MVYSIRVWPLLLNTEDSEDTVETSPPALKTGRQPMLIMYVQQCPHLNTFQLLVLFCKGCIADLNVTLHEIYRCLIIFQCDPAVLTNFDYMWMVNKMKGNVIMDSIMEIDQSVPLQP